MQLTQFSDYALRVLIHLAIHEGERVPLPRIAESYGISRNHLVKTVQTLVAEGFVHSWRGRGGGLELARSADEIRVGDVLRATEPTLDLLGCFEEGSELCVISPVCRLKSVLQGAMASFMADLDRATIADVARPKASLKRLLDRD